ncbi:hypothetical protein [Pseudoxanthobacter sp.]|uniref:hypothetical protein n=1 Tax=Pseudoxanthobacter sp. TaxID=1925742 RepID=UPI002FE282BB
MRHHGHGAGRDGARAVAAAPRRGRVSAAKRAEARVLFEGDGFALTDIAAAAGVTTATVLRWAKAAGWRRGAERPAAAGGAAAGGEPAADRGALVGRLMQAFARQVSEVEARLGSEGGADERDARTLGVLAKTLETLIDLDRAAQGDRAGEEEAKNLDAVREEIARRLDRLRGAG